MDRSRKPRVQLEFPGLECKRTRASHRQGLHGGEYSTGRRKTARPFDPKQALHVVLRSSRARGAHSFLHSQHCNRIRELVRVLQKRWDIRIYRYANVGNHLHLLIRARSRKQWQGFIRQLAGAVAMIVTGARKGHALDRRHDRAVPESAKRGFWDHLVFTRIVPFGRAFDVAARYVSMNLWESFGIPVRRFLDRGFRVLEMSDDGAILACQISDPGSGSTFVADSTLRTSQVARFGTRWRSA